MRIPLHILPLLAFCQVLVLSADARQRAGHGGILRRAAGHLHDVAAVRRASSLARDFRIALSELGRAASVSSKPKPSSVRPVSLRPRAGGALGQAICELRSPGLATGGNGTATTPAGGSGTSTASATASAALPSSSSRWSLAQSYSGSSFFDGWGFFSGDDSGSTHGIVQYVTEAAALSNNLSSINSAGNAIMRVETTPQVTGNRMSIRIQSQYSFNGGLVILDSVHMPTGCGTWPAFWTNGPTWPVTGEIDIVEGVNDYTNNQATIHTDNGCTLPTSNSSALGITGSIVGGTNCAALATNNEGCGFLASQSNSFGAAFNSNGGGVHAMQWDDDSISVYFFPRNAIPSDISGGNPVPESWGLPMAKWPASTCNPSQFFQDQSVVFDTTLCGDLGNAVWATAGSPGQAQSCAQRTGVSTCEDFVRANGAALEQAYWEVKSVDIYQAKA